MMNDDLGRLMPVYPKNENIEHRTTNIQLRSEEGRRRPVKSYKFKAEPDEATSLLPIVATTGRQRAEAG